MSTSAVLNSPASTSAVLPTKSELVNFAVVVTLDPEGKIASARHTSSEKEITKLKDAEYKGGEVIAFEQPVTAYKIGTLEGFEQLIPDAEERLNIINKGLGSKFNQKIKTVLTEVDDAKNLVFQPVEPSYDSLSLLQEASLRTNLSPTDKAIKMLSGLPEEMRAAILAQFAAVSSGS